MSFKDEQNIENEIWNENLIFLEEEQYHFDEVRYIQWQDGIHWYAKVGKLDICDKEGNYKWNTKEEAIEAAKYFCKKLIYEKTVS